MPESTLSLTKEDLVRAVVRQWKGDAAGGSATALNSFTTGTITGTPTYGVTESSGTITVAGGFYRNQEVQGTLAGGTFPNWVKITGEGPTCRFLEPASLVDVRILSIEPGGTAFTLLIDGEFAALSGVSYVLQFSSPDKGTLIETTSTWPDWALTAPPTSLTFTVSSTDYEVTRVYGEDRKYLVIPDVTEFAPSTSYTLDDGGGQAQTVGTVLSDTETQIVEECVRSGYRRFLFPPVLPGDVDSHVWGFLTPVGHIRFTAPYEEGTVTIASGTVTLSGGTWPAWAASGGELIVDGGHHRVLERTSDSAIEIDDHTVSITTGESYSLVRRAYRLPEGFGSMLGGIYFEHSHNDTFPPMTRVGQREFLNRSWKDISLINSSGTLDTGLPRAFKIEPVKSNQTTGQRYELWVHPAADQEYDASFRYDLVPDALDIGSSLHYGGARHAETLLEAVLAAWETLLEGVDGVHNQKFLERLVASVAYDRRQYSAESIGFNRDRSDPYNVYDDDPRYMDHEFHHHRGTIVTVNL